MSNQWLYRLSLLTLALSIIPACKSKRAPSGSAVVASATATATASPDPAPSFAVVTPPPPLPEVPEKAEGYALLKFSHDNINEVLSAAKSAGKLVFVDTWAQWCHTCLSMEAYVLSDPRLGEFASRMQFVALDTDKPVNAPFLARFKMHTWPTFFVIDPAGDKLIGMWPGAASVREMYGFLQQSLEAADALSNGKQSPALSALVQAREAHAAGDYAHAADAYQKALSAAPAAWPQLSEVLLGYSRSLVKLRRYDDCAALGVQYLDAVNGAARPVEFAERIFTCIRRTKRDDRQAQIERIVRKMRDLVGGSSELMSPDDRADALNAFANILTNTRDPQGAGEARAQRLRVIEEAVAKAKTPAQARAFDRHRALSLASQGREKEAFEFLRVRQIQFPLSYEPPAILADVYLQLGNLAEALKALSTAAQLSEGNRKCAFLSKIAEINERLGDKVGQRAALEREIKERKKLSGAAADARALSRAEGALRRLGPAN